MNEFAPLIHSFWYLLRGAAMTVLMATSAVVPATILGVLLALVNIFGGRLMRSAILGYLFLIRGIPLLVLLTFVYYLMP
jgi:polar amino acid transport system permease protein